MAPVTTNATCRTGFTLVEMLVVVAIIAALAAIGFPTMAVFKRKALVSGTQQLVNGVAVAVQGQQASMVTLADGRLARVWDIDGDRVIDGDPRIADADHPNLATVAPPSYTGFLAMTGFDAPAWAADPRRHVIDRWKRPLRIAWSAKDYGAHGFGIWSLGPDGLDGTADDITSWTTGER